MPFLTCLAAALTTAMGTSPAPRVPTSALPSALATSAPDGSFHAETALPSDAPAVWSKGVTRAHLSAPSSIRRPVLPSAGPLLGSFQVDTYSGL